MAEPRGIRVDTEKRPAADARREFEQTLKDNGAIEFDLPYNENGRPRHVVALLEVQTPIAVVGETAKPGYEPREKFVPEFVEDDHAVVGMAGSTGWNFSDERFALDLHDAPEAMRIAVECAWQALESNKARFNGADALPAELQAQQDAMRRRLQPIIEAMRRSQSQTRAVESSPPASPPAEAARSQAPLSVLQRLEQAFGKLSPDLVTLMSKPGTFIAYVDQGRVTKVMAIRLEPVSRNQRIQTWRVAEVAGDPTVSVADTFKPDFANLPLPLKQGLDRTMRVLGPAASGLLKQIQVLKEQGNAVRREQRQSRDALGSSITPMRIGRGSIAWTRRSDGKWEVAQVVDVPGVKKGAVYLADLSNAPNVIRKAAKDYMHIAADGSVIAMADVLRKEAS